MSVVWFLAVMMAVLGLAVGSFLNVVIYRMPRNESIVSPGSHCPKCDTPIKGRYNVPLIGWLVLRGRCSACRESISARYPLVEGGTALLFGALTLHFGLSGELPAYLYLAAVGVALALIDIDVRHLPDSIVLPSYIATLLLLMPAGAVSGAWSSAERGLVGMTALGLIFFALALAYPPGLSFGDVKLAGLVGLYLGWLSWSALLLTALGAFAIAGVGGAVALALRRGPKSGTLPLGPCLVGAAVLAIFVTAPVTHWYGSLITT